MNSPSKFLSSLTVLGLLMTAPACSGVDESADASPAVASVSQAATALTLTIDGDARSYEGMTALINGRDATMDDVAKALGTQTATSKEVRASQDGGAEALVAGATGTLTASEVNLSGLKKLTETALKSVGVRSLFVLGKTTIELRFTAKPSADPQMNEALAQVSQMNALIQDLAKRYPDIEKEDPDAFSRKESVQLEKIATLYCQASGQKPGCAPPTTEGGTARTALLGNWWDWLVRYLLDFSKVGVIPNGTSCPSESPLVQIYHDDEDSGNNNSRGGWLGGFSSDNRGTLKRFCRVDGRNFFPLASAGSQYNYTVLNLSGICPRNTTRYMERHFDDEDSNNANWGSGPTFPNVNVLGRNWVLAFCAFSANAGSSTMSSFPNYGFAYGVFAPSNFPSPLSLGNGYIYQDDQDFLNINFWINGPDNTMNDSSNTWSGLARVK